MELKKKLEWTLLIGLPVLVGGAIYEEHHQRPIGAKNAESCTLRIVQTAISGDTTSVHNVAIFLCDEQDSMYNDCECSQNIPIIDGITGPEPVEAQDIYKDHLAMIYSYSPYRGSMRVDSVHWSINDFEPLLVGIPKLVTSHFPEASLEFVHLMGRIHVLLDGKPCEGMTLFEPFPSEGSINLQTGDIRIENEIFELHSDSSVQLLFPTYYKDTRIRIGDKDFCTNLHIVAGMSTWVYCKSDCSEVKTEIKTW